MSNRSGFLKIGILVCSFFAIAGGSAWADIVPVGEPLFVGSWQQNFHLESDSKFSSIEVHSDAGSPFETGTVIRDINNTSYRVDRDEERDAKASGEDDNRLDFGVVWLWDVHNPVEFSYKACDKDNNIVEEGHLSWDDNNHDEQYEWSCTQSVPDAGSTLLFLGLALAPLAAGYRRWQK
jgi:hypothetical protein